MRGAGEFSHRLRLRSPSSSTCRAWLNSSSVMVQRHQQADDVVIRSRGQHQNAILQTMLHQLFGGLGAGTPLASTNSMACMAPTPRTSTIKACCRCQEAALALKLLAQRAGTRQQLAVGELFEHRQRRRARCGVAAEGAAQAARPGASMISARPVIAATGMPPPRDFAVRMRSGSKPKCGRQKLSGAAKSGLNLIGNKDDAALAADPASAGRNPAGGTTKPPSPSTGSTTMAATDSAATTRRKV